MLALSSRPQKLTFNIRPTRVSDLTGGQNIESRVRCALQLGDSGSGWHTIHAIMITGGARHEKEVLNVQWFYDRSVYLLT